MTDQEQSIASLYARLASIPDKGQLSKGEQLILDEECAEVLSPHLWPSLPSTAQEANNRIPGGYPLGHDLPIWLNPSSVTQEHWGDVCNLMYEHAQELIVPLLSGETVDWTGTYTWFLDQEHRIVLESWNTTADVSDFVPTVIASTLFRQLVGLIKQKPFPFRQCPVCNKVFVPVRKQIYCSPNCMYQGVEGKRRGKRNEYMQQYHRDKKEASQRAQKEETKKQRGTHKKSNN